MISKYHNVLFVHVPKCAGQSIEKSFLDDLDIDWQNRSKLLLRKKNKNENGPQRLAHLYGYEYVKFGYITKEQFHKYFKFAVLRDPLDRIISELNFQKIRKGFLGFRSIKSYIKHIIETKDENHDSFRHIAPQTNYLLDENKEKCILDKVITLKNIQTDFKEIKNKYFSSKNIELKNKNVSKFKVWSKEIISKEDLEFIYEFYKRDYEFLKSL